MKKSDRRMVRGIAIFKLTKAALLLTFGILALRLAHTDVAGRLLEMVPRIGIGPGSHYLGRVLVESANLSPNRIRDVGVGSLIYAALFTTEGIGLWLLKRWAEWMTIVITSSLVPVEVYELVAHPHWGKAALLAVNLGLVAYLVYVVKKEIKGEDTASAQLR